ncbi:defective in Cullin neddylation protein [Histoplasma capsulatum G186AR]|uniref:Defective in cullin neddylation protein n=1 Tax=Ajellomyces capsulatus (strain G186AR / H82 / ATCC MYA-2454 / RMSCC 2432) TaxID=447093 RepID=C0NW84_AJECG|nr:defective in Cullin neddylation protein [Histoplasma capsulatum G186AR]EEH04189.1 defective in Cullin neddylation protein [Histoplasma capsulatum G186AR]
MNNRNPYYQKSVDSGSNNAVAELNKLFDSYRDDPVGNPDVIGIEGAVKYLGDIQVQLDEVVCLAIAEHLRSPSMGEFTREHFVDGWKNINCDTISKQTSYAAMLRARIPNEPDLFRRVYRYTFIICRLAGQRNLTLDIATEQWRLFFTTINGGINWNTRSTPWLDWWIEFVEESWKRPVNKDLWEQVEVFMRKTKEDETFDWWSEDGAWPGAIDEFVGYVRAKRGGKGVAVEAMEVE